MDTIIEALAAAVAGFVDYLTAPMPVKLKRTATKHLLFNLGITVLYTTNYFLRARTPEIPIGYVLSVVAFTALLYSGWLGGDLAYEHRVGVKEKAQEAPRREERAVGAGRR